MKKLIQTRLHTGNLPWELGNCFPTVIACILKLDSPEDVIQIQEYYTYDNWVEKLLNWLSDRNYELETIENHLYDDSYYFVSGKTERGTTHVVIFSNGKLIWDPHPDNTGLIEESSFQRLIKFKVDLDGNRIYKFY